MRCPKCGSISAMKCGMRSHQCPYCGYVMKIEEAQIICRAGSGREAREIIRRLTTPKGLKRSGV
ncbi:MAG: DUF1922 domain-containing protein [Crenarchaeota archaeon]|nr:DUF1922 domain-containing protein [Thermoproteota archaeon]